MTRHPAASDGDKLVALPERNGARPGADRISFEKVVESSPAGIAILEGDRIVYCNRSFERIFGYDGGELVGTSIRDLYPDESQSAAMQRTLETPAPGTSLNGEGFFQHRGGQPVWCRVRASAIGTSAGPATQWVVEDATFSRASEQQLRQIVAEHKLIFDNAMLGIAYLKDRVIYRCNRRMTEVFGWSTEELLGASTERLFPTREAWVEAGRRIYSRENHEDVVDGTFEFVRKDGRRIVGHAMGKALDSGNQGDNWIWIYEDVTDRQAAEAALLRAKAELEQRVGERTAEMARSNRALQDQLHFVNQLIEAMPSPVYFKDENGRFIGCNSAFVAYLGIPREQLIGKSVFDISAAADAAAYHEADRRLLDNPGTQSYDAQVRYADGSLHDVAFFKATFHKADGNLGGIVGVMLDITERKTAERAFREQGDRLRLYFELPLIGMARLSLREGWLEVNDKLCDILGYERAELMSRTWNALTHPDDAALEVPTFAAVLRGEIDDYDIDKRLLRRDGSAIHANVIMRCVRDADGDVDYFVIMVQDISERKLLEERQRLSATVFENAAEGVMIVDTRLRIIAVNRTFTEITGYERDEVLGKNPRILHSGRRDPGFYRQMWETIAAEGRWRGEVWNRARDGREYAELLTISAVRDTRGAITHYVGIFSDITSIKETQASLAHQAHHDPLTGLPNRLAFEARVGEALARKERGDARLAVMFIDLDRFKNINDTLGHPVGDEVLREIAGRLRDALGPGDTIARVGGDEFIVLIDDLERPEDAASTADRMLRIFADPLQVRGQEFFVSASIGISLYPEHGGDVAALVRNADSAMYRAKDLGRSGFEYYSAEMTTNVAERFSLESDLRRAIARREFCLHYQPQFSLHDGSLVGAEALLRWQHPERGLVPPGVFIPLAEETALIEPIGLIAFEDVCRQLAAWRDSGLDPLPVAVNISEVQMRRADLASQLAAIVSRCGIPWSLIKLEITEGVLLRDTEARVATLVALRDFGARLAIDDFGTGYSSLSYLKRLPIDTLKLDRSFVRDLPDDADDAAIARAVIALGHNLGLSVIAEGVEDEAQEAFLRDAGCDELQGYLRGRPVPAGEFERLHLAPRVAAKAN